MPTNPENDELELYKKSQKLVVFYSFFAEDKGLSLNSITQIVKEWAQLKELDACSPLYDNVKLHFGYMNNGQTRTRKRGYIPTTAVSSADALLDVFISDDVLKKYILKLTEYDFDTDVNTNILRHIYRHSLNDIENVRAQLAGEELDKSKTKRKKDEILHAQVHTKYTSRQYDWQALQKRRKWVEINDDVYGDAKKRSRKRIANLEAYREWLLQLTICDPACGSGAFLNQALEFLINEHSYLDELTATYHKASLILSDVESHILEKNLFGVDINEESVEIARLSLWLRTAKKGRKLTSSAVTLK